MRMSHRSCCRGSTRHGRPSIRSCGKGRAGRCVLPNVATRPRDVALETVVTRTAFQGIVAGAAPEKVLPTSPPARPEYVAPDGFCLGRRRFSKQTGRGRGSAPATPSATFSPVARHFAMKACGVTRPRSLVAGPRRRAAPQPRRCSRDQPRDRQHPRRPPGQVHPPFTHGFRTSAPGHQETVDGPPFVSPTNTTPTDAAPE